MAYSCEWLVRLWLSDWWFFLDISHCSSLKTGKLEAPRPSARIAHGAAGTQVIRKRPGRRDTLWTNRRYGKSMKIHGFYRQKKWNVGVFPVFSLHSQHLNSRYAPESQISVLTTLQKTARVRYVVWKVIYKCLTFSMKGSLPNACGCGPVVWPTSPLSWSHADISHCKLMQIAKCTLLQVISSDTKYKPYPSIPSVFCLAILGKKTTHCALHMVI